MTTDEQIAQLAATTSARFQANDEQISKILTIVEHQLERSDKLSEQIDKVTAQVAQLSHEWQAYLTTIRPQ